MNEANELWSLPWRKLQKNLANGVGTVGSRIGFLAGEAEVSGSAISSLSWLARARHRHMCKADLCNRKPPGRVG